MNAPFVIKKKFSINPLFTIASTLTMIYQPAFTIKNTQTHNDAMYLNAIQPSHQTHNTHLYEQNKVNLTETWLCSEIFCWFSSQFYNRSISTCTMFSVKVYELNILQCNNRQKAFFPNIVSLNFKVFSFNVWSNKFVPVLVFV